MLTHGGPGSDDQSWLARGERVLAGLPPMSTHERCEAS